MSVRVLRGAEVMASRPWGAVPAADFGDLAARIHWTDAAYPWHVNDGAELFVVLDGEVLMQWRARDGAPLEEAELHTGDVWSGRDGVVHRAIPRGEARVLVVEAREGETLVDSA
ncbi:cupin domain-containing protein [Lysobacter sp. HA18]